MASGKRGIVVFLVVLMAAGAVYATDWSQWRGPKRDGKADSGKLLSQWPEGGPKLAWQSDGLGVGYSSISMSDKHMFTMGDHGDRQFLIGMARENGKVLWKIDIGPSWPDKNFPGPRGTPTIDGDHVYAISTEGDLVCASTAGKLVWKRSLTNDFGGFMSAGQKVHWKYSESPLIDGDKIIVTPGANEAAMVALNKKTGDEIWRAAIPSLGERGADGAGYSSVMISNAGGVKQYVQMLGRGVIGVEAETGRYLWGYNRVANDVANITTPLIDGDKVFVTTGYGTGSALLKLSKSGDGVSAEQVYWLDAKTMQNHHGGVILEDGYLYTGTGHNKGFPLCVEMATGKVVWGPIRNEGEKSAAVTYADGHIYMRYQNGLVVLVEATPEEYREKGSFMIPDVKQFSWAHPVVADGKLFLREQDRLYAYDIAG